MKARTLGADSPDSHVPAFADADDANAIRAILRQQDFAVAIMDEAESRSHAGRSFTVGW